MQRRAGDVGRLFAGRDLNAYDALALRLIQQESDDEATRVFCDVMRDYLQNLSATKRWEFLHAIVKGYRADFRTLCRFLREHGIPFEVRPPRDDAEST